MKRKSGFNENYQLWYLSEMQELINKRQSKMTIAGVSRITGISEKTIQRFERYESENMKLFYFYKYGTGFA
jgi:response regulator of citrate/malate metabolism